MFYDIKVGFCNKEHVAEFGYKVEKFLCFIGTLNPISIVIVLTSDLFLPSYFMLLSISVIVYFPFTHIFWLHMD